MSVLRAAVDSAAVLPVKWCGGRTTALIRVSRYYAVVEGLSAPQRVRAPPARLARLAHIALSASPCTPHASPSCLPLRLPHSRRCTRPRRRGGSAARPPSPRRARARRTCAGCSSMRSGATRGWAGRCPCPPTRNAAATASRTAMASRTAPSTTTTSVTGRPTAAPRDRTLYDPSHRCAPPTRGTLLRTRRSACARCYARRHST